MTTCDGNDEDRRRTSREAKLAAAEWALAGDLEWYEGHALRTAQGDAAAFAARAAAQVDLIHAALGVTSEAGELADAVKKHLAYGRPLDATNVVEELGDLLWYVALAADAVGVSLREVCVRNIAKLRRRYEGGRFTERAATVRDLGAERVALEGGENENG